VFSSLRVRLPLLFMGGVLLAALVTTLIAVRLFQEWAHDQTVSELRREAAGIARLYSNAIRETFDVNRTEDSRRAPHFASTSLELATGDRLFWVAPTDPFPGERSGLTRLELKPPELAERVELAWKSGQALTFEFNPPGVDKTFLAVAEPVLPIRNRPAGAIVVAKEKADIDAGVNALVRRLAIAGALGIAAAGIFGFFFSRRLVRPVLALSDAADEVAAGHYDVEVPRAAPGEIGHLAERFGEMAERLAEAETHERNFLMSVSHELRTPLTAIRGHVSALLEGVVEDPEQRVSSLEVVEAEAQRLERLVGDILDLAKLDTRRFTLLHEEVDMRQLVERAYETFGEEARRREMDFRVEVHERPVIVSDGDRVLQIVANLLSNAFRATPDGGRVALELSQEHGEVHVAVEDTGPGIDPARREALFRPFVSGDGGTGLGLTIARELSTALGGRIELESEVGRGSRFELVLPAGYRLPEDVLVPGAR
jgi:signal transduction histidine kinase